MKVFIERTNEYKEVGEGVVRDILKRLDINPTTVIVTKNNELVTEDEKLKPKDEIRILSVISGG